MKVICLKHLIQITLDSTDLDLGFVLSRLNKTINIKTANPPHNVNQNIPENRRLTCRRNSGLCLLIFSYVKSYKPSNHIQVQINNKSSPKI